MKLSTFIETHLDNIVAEWESFARTLVPAQHMSACTSGPDGRSKTSLGLGLFVVREIVRGHAGTVEVESAAATGTVFTVRLPRVARRDAGHQLATSSSVGAI